LLSDNDLSVMPLDTSKVNQKINVESGLVLFEEGSLANSLNIIHEGAYSVEKRVGDMSIPLFQISGKNLTPGIISLFTSGRYTSSIQSTQNSIISTYQVNNSTIKKTIMSKMSLGVMVARTLLREIIELTKRANVIQSLSASVEKTLDNLALMYYKLEPSVFQDIDLSQYVYSEEEYIPEDVLRLVRKNLSNFLESGGILPEKPSIPFVDDNHGELLKKEYREELDFEDQEFMFMRKILSLDPNIQTPLYEADITVLLQICEKFSFVFEKLVEIIEEEVLELHKNLEFLLGKEISILEKYYMLLDQIETGISDEKPEVILPITEFAAEKINKFLLTYRNIFYKEFPNASENVQTFIDKSKNLSDSMSGSSSVEADSNTAITAGVDKEVMKKDLENSVQKIINFAKLPPEQYKEFVALLIKLKSMKNPLDPDNDARKIRKNIAKTYWDAYNAAALKYVETKSVPKPVEMMLRFGYMDETLLEPGQLAFLYTYEDESRPQKKVPSHFCTEWLEQVYNKKVPTSLDELGQTFFDKVKNEHKDKVFKKESDMPSSIDTSEARLKYEINAMYQPNVRLTTGNPATYLPILTKYQISIPLDKCIVTRDSLSNALSEILAVDYTAFNREIVYNDEQVGIRKELVQKSVVPDFIIVPSLGTKIMMWQDLSLLRGAGSKESRGRIILPMFVSGDLKILLLEAIAAFRWELTKNILGPDWNNVGIPSITSEYMDYIQFFKKNKDLSIEMKEKLAAEFKRFRTDRDKFVNDYLLWIKYESEGVQRLNRVVRSIFYKHIPFQKETRDKISKLPAYADMHNRFTNIRNRQFKETEARYRKYMDPSGKLPPVLQENLDFYRV
jgi:hypothetical protein